ncbi:EamA family transporter RarD [Croceibacterium sp. LX-88]|uniref:EamA family transporter RarD n=2 Tax=Croceibacterium selenioxidans TaxID=2838833 RepID=A0ABS5W0Q1_9SPHN|nr:EamA family transporter RarD [Croceibacterium selenioxidans]
MPLYLLLVHQVPPIEFVAWRIIFTLPLCLVFLTWSHNRGNDGWGELRAVLADRRALLTLLASAALIGVNWSLYVWAIQTEHVYAASLGYYILPLAMMLMGLVVLGERLNRIQWCALLLAGVGVTALAIGALTTLWLSLSMALSFGIYGLLRKTVAAGALVGLTIESLLLLLPAVAIVSWYAASPAGTVIGRDTLETAAIAWAGPMTAIPLIWFAIAARRMPYTVLGFLQFISPTIVFLIGLLVFGEKLRPAQLACFVAIWAAAGLFVWDLLRRRSASEAH